jgi:hypothetical protein
VSKAKKEYRKGLRLRKEEAGYLPGMAPERAPTLFDFADMSDKNFLDQSEDSILAALKQYAERAENGHTVQRRLFADDAARGFAFIDLCRKCYDVVLMNPPYGGASENVSGYLSSVYKEGNHDIYAIFLEMAAGRCLRHGLVGALTSRTFLFNERFIVLRKEVLTSSLQVLADLGFGVLDAAVDVAAFVYLVSRTCQDRILCINSLATEDKSVCLLSSVNAIGSGRLESNSFYPSRQGLRALPESVFCYSVSPGIENLFKKLDPLYPSTASVLKGLITGDDFSYLRTNWEVDPASIGRARIWEWFHKGGEYSPYYSDVHLLVGWNSEGARLKAEAAIKYGSATRTIKNEVYFRKPVLGYGVVNSIGFSVKTIPEGTLFGDVGPVILPKSTVRMMFLLGFLNSELVRVILRVRQVGERGRFAWTSNLIEQIPVPSNDIVSVSKNAGEITMLFQELSRTEEKSPIFSGLPVFSMSIESGLKSILCSSSKILEGHILRMEDAENQIDSAVYEHIGVHSDDVSAFTVRLTKAEKPTTCFCTFVKKYANDFGRRVISWLLGCAFGRWDIRIAIDQSLTPKLPDPFDPLPVCPPGMLIGPDVLPAEPNAIVSEEWLRARPGVNRLPPEGVVKNPTIPDSEYPLRIAWNGILVDDPGFNGSQPNRDDIIRRVREVFELLWKDKAHEIEQEACDILGVSDLRDYFRKPAKFFPGSFEAVLQESAEGSDLLAAVYGLGLLHDMDLL